LTDPLANLVQQGIAALRQGDPKGARATFERCAASGRAAPQTWLLLAQSCRLGGDDVAADKALDTVLATDGRNLHALLIKGDIAARREDDRTASSWYGAAMSAAGGRNDLPADLIARLDEAAAFCAGAAGRFRAHMEETLFAKGVDTAAHWSGVLQLSQGMGQLSTEFQDICIKAQSFVDRFSRGLAETVDAGLAEVRNNIDGAARRRFDAAIDHALGRRRIYQNKCDGMFFPFLPADEFFDRKHFPWLSEIETRTDAIRKELDALLARGSVFSPYVTQAPGTPSNLWTTLDNSSDWDSRFLTKFGAQDHAARQLCPATASAMDALPLFDIPGRGPNVFFSLLRAGAHIPAHTGVSNTRAIVHLPLIVPDHCTFRVGGETRTWQVGHAFAFDDTIEHEARNDSDALRAVLIFDVWNPHLSAEERELLTTFFAIADAGA
jgi:aspartyl/asparaginyl beta-hydroxylase (cupin superfamily)